jgi:hypothetical protein
MLRELFHRLRACLRRGKVEREMERELRFHLEMETAENIRRGMSEEEARRAALLSFGGVEQTKENLRDARGLGWLEDMLQDFRYALRALRRKPGFAAVALFQRLPDHVRTIFRLGSCLVTWARILTGRRPPWRGARDHHQPRFVAAPLRRKSGSDWYSACF